MKFRIFKQVPKIIYGPGSINRTSELMKELGYELGADTIIIYDASLSRAFIDEKIGVSAGANLYKYGASNGEPTVFDVDKICSEIRQHSREVSMIIGVGGGSTMDVAKGVSVALTNHGSIADFQGWDLPVNKPVPKIGIPTIFGSGSEASRTAVFYNGQKKQGVNSDFSMFDAIILDPELSSSVPLEQKIFTAMDCYIHCVESLEGTYINQIAEGFAQKALNYCKDYFLDMKNEELLAVASYFGGVSIVNSEVGLCHALSYGVSKEFGVRHGLANCIVFNVLDEYYGDHVVGFQKILRRYNVTLPSLDIPKDADDIFDRMIEQAYLMEKPLENALGQNWRTKLSPEKIKTLYGKM